MSTNGCGSGGTSGAYIITLGMVQPHLRGTSPPPGGFASTGCPGTPLGFHWVMTAKRQLETLLFCVCVYVRTRTSVVSACVPVRASEIHTYEIVCERAKSKHVLHSTHVISPTHLLAAKH